VAEIVDDCTSRSAILLRDVVVLVPFVQLVEPARRAFAAHGGWQPRIETTATLALAPPALPAVGQLAGAPVLDALTLAQMLRGLDASGPPAPARRWRRIASRGRPPRRQMPSG
jgi:ATP-dependent helicase/nuclease subunit B